MFPSPQITPRTPEANRNQMPEPPPHFVGMPNGWPLPDFLSGGHLHFLHIGKCAGTSVRLLAQSCFSAEESFQHILGVHGYPPPHQFEAAWADHPSGAFSCSHVGSTIFELCDTPLNVFTWLRDPLETCFSTLYFVMQQVDIAARRSPSFVAVADIVRSSAGPHDAFLKVAECFKDQPVQDFHPFRPLTHLLSQPARRAGKSRTEVVRSAIDSLHKCFFIGLVEEQQTSLEMLSRFLPLRSPKHPFCVNRTLIRPNTKESLTEEQTLEISTMLAGEYEVYHEAKRLWELQRTALQEEGWLRLQPEQRATQAFRRLHPVLLEQGRWTADAPAFAEGLNDVEFDEATSASGRFFWRWTSPGDHAAIRLPIRPAPLMALSIEISKITPIPQIEAIGLAVGGERLPVCEIGQSEKTLTFLAIVRGSLLSEEGSDLEIFSSTPFRPSLGDPRQLGAAIVSISWNTFRS